MRSVPETLRRHLLDGLAVSGLSLLCQGTALSLTGTRQSVTLDGALRGDDYYDHEGGQALWGESDLKDQTPLCLFNMAAVGQTSAWYVHGVSGVTTLADDETVLAYSSPGLHGQTPRAFYVDGAGDLRWRDLNAAATAWSGASSVIASLGLLEGAACRAVSATAVQVAGYADDQLWLQRFTYSAGVWTAGTRQTVSYVADGRFLPQTLGVYGDVVTLDLGGGRGVSLRHQGGQYSAPYAILGLPPDQKVTPWGLSYQNGRYILVVTTQVYGENGYYYAHHARAVSSPDGQDWRDEGPLVPLVSGLRNPTPMRGKLLATETASYLLSPAGCYTGNLPVWLSATPTTSFTVVPFEATGSHGGLMTTQELTALVRPDARLVAGLRVTATLTDGAESVTLFQGYLDQTMRQSVLGQDYTRLVARGPLGRLIGETAYRPVALMDLPGRNAWWTGFYDAASGLGVNALASADGEWLAEMVAGTYRLYAATAGTAFIPQAYSAMSGGCYVRFAASNDFYLTFGNSDETDKAGQKTGSAWAAGIRGSQLVLGRFERGTWTAYAAVNLVGYTANAQAELFLHLSAGRIEVVLAPSAGCNPGDWQRLTYAPSGQAWPSAWTLGVYAPRVLASDGTYTARPVSLYEALGCTADVPWSVGETVARVAERAGARVSNVTTTYTPGGAAPYVSLVNCRFAALSAGQTLRLKGRLDSAGNPAGTLLTFSSGYVTIDGRAWPYPGDQTGLVDVRVVWYDDVLALYSRDRLLLCCHLRPAFPSGYLWSTANFTLLDLYMPAEAAAWDYNQAADTVMGRLLERRRAYLVETVADGIRLSASAEGSEVIGPGNPFLGHQSYERTGAVSGEQRGAEARGAAGLIGIIGMQDTVYILDPEAPAYGLASQTLDNPWALSVEDGLREATLTVYDNRRARQRCEVAGLFDPALEITDVFTLSDGSQWLAGGYNWQFSMDEKAQFEARLVGQGRAQAEAGGTWGTAVWGGGYWA